MQDTAAARKKARAIKPGSFLSLLVNARHTDSGEPLSELEAAAQAFTFLLAGAHLPCVLFIWGPVSCIPLAGAPSRVICLVCKLSLRAWSCGNVLLHSLCPPVLCVSFFYIAGLSCPDLRASCRCQPLACHTSVLCQ